MSTTDRDRDRLMDLINHAIDFGGLHDELGDGGFDAFWYDDDPVAAITRRCLLMQTNALAAIAFLLLRRDQEMWDAWERY